MQKKSISIIGGGIGGLATAVLMAKDGHDVSVYEKNECLGGRASIFSEKGYTFDMGPSWYLMPDLFEKFFNEIGENIHDHLDLVQLSPSYKVFYPETPLLTRGAGGDQSINNNINRDLTPLFDQFGIKEGIPIVERNISVAIVYDPKTNTYLGIKRFSDNAQSFVGGGIDDGEDPIITGRREVYEETGYKNLRLIKELSPTRALFRHEGKGKNYKTYCRNFVYELVDDAQDSIDPKELLKHTPQRIPADQVHDFLSNKKDNKPMYDHLFVWETWVKNNNKLQSLNVYADIDRMADQFEQMEMGAGQKFRNFLKTSGEQYGIGMEFALRNYDSILDFFKRDIAIKGMKLNIITTIDKYVARFFKTPIIQKIMQYTTVFLGTSPKQTPAFYNIMSHVDFAMGVRYPQGGLHAIATALVNIGKKYGVQYHIDSEVIEVQSNKGKVESMTIKTKSMDCFVPRSDGHCEEAIADEAIHTKTITSDLFIVNADQARFETAMLPLELQTYTKKFWDKKTFAPSGFIIYAGIDKKIKNLEHHNLYFNDNRDESFGAIYDRHVLADDPSIYICAPGKTDPNVAPKGKENLFILVPITNGINISEEEKSSYRDKIRKIVEEMTGENLIDHIEYERIFEIKDFTERYHAWKGTALGLGHTMMQTASFRPNNYSKKISNLFYVGHNTNPGIGVPMVIVSAMLVKERIYQKVK